MRKLFEVPTYISLQVTFTYNQKVPPPEKEYISIEIYHFALPYFQQISQMWSATSSALSTCSIAWIIPHPLWFRAHIQLTLWRLRRKWQQLYFQWSQFLKEQCCSWKFLPGFWWKQFKDMGENGTMSGVTELTKEKPVPVPLCWKILKTIWNYFSFQCSPRSEKIFICFKLLWFHLFAILITVVLRW